MGIYASFWKKSPIFVFDSSSFSPVFCCTFAAIFAKFSFSKKTCKNLLRISLSALIPSFCAISASELDFLKSSIVKSLNHFTSSKRSSHSAIIASDKSIILSSTKLIALLMFAENSDDPKSDSKAEVSLNPLLNQATTALNISFKNPIGSLLNLSKVESFCSVLSMEALVLETAVATPVRPTAPAAFSRALPAFSKSCFPASIGEPILSRPFFAVCQADSA